MKSQDIVLLLKLASLESMEVAALDEAEPRGWPSGNPTDQRFLSDMYKVTNLASSLGLSKSVISVSLNHCIDIGLAKRDRSTQRPRVNRGELFNIITTSVKYFWPARLGQITRGIATAYAAPVLSERLSGVSEFAPVWPDARGKTMGQSVERLHPCVNKAVRGDPQLYTYLALVDAVRVGNSRESNIAISILTEQLLGNPQ